MVRNNKITVFYDGNCGLCAKEIRYYKKIAPPNIFEWIDITQTPEPFVQKGYCVSQGLKALHVEDRQENMHIGVPAFIEIWRHLKGWSILGKIIGLPVIKQIANFVYKLFANWRFKSLGYCEKP